MRLRLIRTEENSFVSEEQFVSSSPCHALLSIERRPKHRYKLDCVSEKASVRGAAKTERYVVAFKSVMPSLLCDLKYTPSPYRYASQRYHIGSA